MIKKLYVSDFRTDPATVDLHGAQPDIDWQGNRNLERVVRMVREQEVDWCAKAIEELDKHTALPKGTKVKRLYYYVLLSTYNPYLEPFAEIDHCDFPDMLARKMADYENRNATITGITIKTCATLEYPGGKVDKCYELGSQNLKLNEWECGGTLITPDKEEEEKPYEYRGSRNIAYLLDKAIEDKKWEDPYALPLSEYPLRPTELTSLYDRAVREIKLSVFLSRRGEKSEEVYMTLDAEDFPSKLGEKLLADDKEGQLGEIAKMNIRVSMKIDGESFEMDLPYELPDGFGDNWKPYSWDLCVVEIDWQADQYLGTASKAFARPDTPAAKKYPTFRELVPLRIKSSEMKGAAVDLFPSITVVYYSDTEMIIEYGEMKYTITPEKAFKSDEKGRDYATFQLTVRLSLDQDNDECGGDEGDKTEAVGKEKSGKHQRENSFKIEDGVLQECELWQSHVEIPDGVTTIETNAFSRKEGSGDGTVKLVSVVVPSSVRVIKHYAFRNCRYLESVVVKGAAKIEDEAFWGCKRLHDVDLGDEVRSLGRECFGYCDTLQTLFIPASVEAIGSRIACQNEHSNKLMITCERKGPAACWRQDWNECYSDPRFNNSYHTSSHKVVYGMTRSGFSREAVEWLYSSNKWSELFDRVYTPGKPQSEERLRSLALFYNHEAINRLKPEQVEIVRRDSANQDNITACFLYAYWLHWNATSLRDQGDVERLATIAAKGGYNAMWSLLRYISVSGTNSEARIDKEKAERYASEALKNDSDMAFFTITLIPLLYESDDKKDHEKALSMVQERIKRSGGESSASEIMLNAMSESYMALGDRKESERYARLSLKKSPNDRAYGNLLTATCIEGDEWNEGGEERANKIFEEGLLEGNGKCMYNYALLMKEKADNSSGEQKRLYELKVRQLMERAALMGNYSACWDLVVDTSSGKYGACRASVRDAYPFMLRGAMAGSCKCAYWLYRYQETALDEDVEVRDREVTLAAGADKCSPDVWRSFAKSLYEYDKEPWPGDEE